MATTPEGKTKAAIDKMLKKYNVWYFKPVSNGMGMHGVMDYICCVKGKFLGIEAKADEKKKPTALQEMQMHRIRENNGLAMVIHINNLDALEIVLQELTA